MSAEEVIKELPDKIEKKHKNQILFSQEEMEKMKFNKK